MKLAVDTSSFAKRYIQEEGSDRLDDFLRDASELALCVITVPELISALNRRLREGSLTDSDYRNVKKLIMDDIKDTILIQITPAVVLQSIKLLEKTDMRAMDALHVACAIEWKADLFITSDKRQLDAATHSGLRSEYLGRAMN